MTDAAQEQQRAEDWTDDVLASYLEDIAGSRLMEPDKLGVLKRRLREAARRLRARQWEEGDDFDPSMLDVLEEAAQKLTKRPAGEHGPLLMGLDRIKGAIRRHLDATPQRDPDCSTCGGDGNISTGVPGVEELLPCPDCATPQREGEREPVAWRWRLKGSSMGWIYWPEEPTDIAEPHDWDIQPLYTQPGAWSERLAGALAAALASAELVRRRGNEPDWWRCSACWSTGRGPGEIEHEPDCPEAVYAAWKAETDSPAGAEEKNDG